MASIPRAQQVLAEQVRIRPTRYEAYHSDLLALLNDALRAISDGTDRTKRRRDLADAIKAKASQVSTAGSES